MKTLLIPRAADSLAKPAASAFVGLLALLPAVLMLSHLTWPGAMGFAALGPVAASFWLAVAVSGSRLQLVSWTTVLSVVLLAINWIITAGPGCCKTLESR